MDKTDFTCPVDLEKAVQVYCEGRDVVPVFVKILPDKYVSATARCRISVNDADWGTIMDPLFWPEDVEVREWYTKDKELNTKKATHDG